MSIQWEKHVNSYTDNNGNGITRSYWIGRYTQNDVIIEVKAGNGYDCVPTETLDEPENYEQVEVRAYRQSDPHFMYLQESSEIRQISLENIPTLANTLEQYSGDYKQAFQVI